MIKSCRNVWEKFSVTSEVMTILMIIALVLFLQFWGVKAVYQHDTFWIEKEYMIVFDGRSRLES